MVKRKSREFKVCGLAGKTARSVARNLLSGIKVNKEEAEQALAHINECDFCRLRIKNHISDARKGKKKKVYLDSLPETLREIERLVG